MSRYLSAYGVEADERQQLDHYRAASRAFRIMLGAAFIAYVATWFIENMVAELIAGGIFLIGLNAYGFLIERSGWEDFVQEQIATREDVRRRAWRSALLGSLISMTLLFLYDSISNDSSPMQAFLHALSMGIVLTVTRWWLEIRAAKRRYGDRPTID